MGYSHSQEAPAWAHLEPVAALTVDCAHGGVRVGMGVGVGKGGCLAAAIVTLMITMTCHLSCRQAVNGPSLHTCARLCWGLGQGHTP